MTGHPLPLSSKDVRRPVRLLLVEDNPADAEYVREILDMTEDAQVELRCAESMAEARLHLADAPDCALLDLGLPDTAGLEGVHELARCAPELPIVVLTGQRDRAVALEAVKHGAQDYVTKSDLDAEAVLRTIHYAIERKRAERGLRARATQDPLTGLANRVLLMERLAIALERQPVPRLALCFIDLDGFKQINDDHGHAAGDRLLMDVAASLVATMRPEDTVARFGGDEFAVLCDEISQPECAIQIGERILARINELASPQRPISASVGVVFAVDADLDAEALLVRADEAMYRAKRAGKGRVAVHDAASAATLSSLGTCGAGAAPHGRRVGEPASGGGLHEAEQLLEATFDRSPIGMALVERRSDGAVRLLRTNQALCALSRRTQQELLDRGPGLLDGLTIHETPIDATGDTTCRAVWHITAQPTGPT